MTKDKRCPITGVPVRSLDKDVIRLKTGGTGFAGHDANLLEAQRTGEQMGFA